jgi:hypothetical protein
MVGLPPSLPVQNPIAVEVVTTTGLTRSSVTYDDLQSGWTLPGNTAAVLPS